MILPRALSQELDVLLSPNMSYLIDAIAPYMKCGD
jgi:hypothetical protein